MNTTIRTRWGRLLAATIVATAGLVGFGSAEADATPDQAPATFYGTDPAGFPWIR